MRGPRAAKAARSSVSRQLFPPSQWPPDAPRARAHAIFNYRLQPAFLLFFCFLFFSFLLFLWLSLFHLGFIDTIDTVYLVLPLLFWPALVNFRLEEAKEEALLSRDPVVCCFVGSATQRSVQLELPDRDIFKTAVQDEKTTKMQLDEH